MCPLSLQVPGMVAATWVNSLLFAYVACQSPQFPSVPPSTLIETPKLSLMIFWDAYRGQKLNFHVKLPISIN